MYFSEYYSNPGFPVPKESCVTTPDRSASARSVSWRGWPPAALVAAQMLFCLVLAGVGVADAVLAAVALLAGDVLAVTVRAGALGAAVVRMLTAAGGGQLGAA
jgi:hypothetical protein